MLKVCIEPSLAIVFLNDIGYFSKNCISVIFHGHCSKPTFLFKKSVWNVLIQATVASCAVIVSLTPIFFQ